MRIAALTKRRDACWWMRVLNPMSALNEIGHEYNDELLELQEFCRKCGHGPREIQHNETDAEFRCLACKEVICTQAHVSKWRDRVMDLIRSSELIVFQRPTHTAHVALMLHAKLAGKKVVQTADDNYIDVPRWNPGYKYYMDRQPAVIDSFKEANAVDVTTVGLKALYSKYNSKIEVLPNCQDVDLINAFPALPHIGMLDRSRKRISDDEFNERRHGHKVIIWGGSPTHEKDLEIALPAIRRLARSEKVIFVMVGYCHRAMIEIVPEKQLFLHGIVSNTDYFPLYKAIKADIGMAPVIDHPFNRHGKSSNKVIEYALLGIIPVASDLETYRGALPKMMLARPDERSWFDAFRKAIHEFPEEWIQENRDYASEHHNIRKQVGRWEKFYQDVLGA